MVGYVIRALIFGVSMALVSWLLSLEFDWRMATYTFVVLFVGGLLEPRRT